MCWNLGMVNCESSLKLKWNDFQDREPELALHLSCSAGHHLQGGEEGE